MMPHPTPDFSWRRVWAMMLRHLYLLRSSWTRLVELAYWPSVSMVIWGFLTLYLAQQGGVVARATGLLLGAVMLWDVLFRGNLGLSLSFMEEMWSRNLGHLSVSPLRPAELVVALVAMSLIRTLIGVIPATLLALWFYDYSIYGLGLPLVAFFALLMMTGWAVGLSVSAMVLRHGLGAESLAWVAIFAIAPLGAIYYPVDVLPGWLQPVALALPPAHVFEGMRAVMFGQPLPWDHMAWALGLNLLYLGGAAGLFFWTYHQARVKGLLLNMGE